MIHYLDTTALVKRYISESGSRSVRDLFRRGKPLAVARIAYVELAAALCRLRREKLLTERDQDRILLATSRYVKGW